MHEEMKQKTFDEIQPSMFDEIYVGGPLVGGFQTNRPSPGGSSSRPMVARPVRYGRAQAKQRKTFLDEIHTKWPLPTSQLHAKAPIAALASVPYRVERVCVCGSGWL